MLTRHLSLLGVGFLQRASIFIPPPSSHALLPSIFRLTRYIGSSPLVSSSRRPPSPTLKYGCPPWSRICTIWSCLFAVRGAFPEARMRLDVPQLFPVTMSIEILLSGAISYPSGRGRYSF